MLRNATDVYSEWKHLSNVLLSVPPVPGGDFVALESVSAGSHNVPRFISSAAMKIHNPWNSTNPTMAEMYAKRMTPQCRFHDVG
jgi:hypothetical protein